MNTIRTNTTSFQKNTTSKKAIKPELSNNDWLHILWIIPLFISITLATWLILKRKSSSIFFWKPKERTITRSISEPFEGSEKIELTPRSQTDIHLIL